MAASLMLGQIFWGKNLIKNLLESQISAPDQVWQKLLWAWLVFFATMGALNLCVAYTFSTSFWVSFKLFGFLGLMLVFIIGQTLYLSKHSQPS
jgi:intracellular septation protein